MERGLAKVVIDGKEPDKATKGELPEHFVAVEADVSVEQGPGTISVNGGSG